MPDTGSAGARRTRRTCHAAVRRPAEPCGPADRGSWRGFRDRSSCVDLSPSVSQLSSLSSPPRPRAQPPATSRSSRGTFRPRARQSSPMARAPRTTRARPTRSSTRCAQTPVSAADQGGVSARSHPGGAQRRRVGGARWERIERTPRDRFSPPGTVTRGHRIVPGALRDARTGRGLRVDRHRRVVGWREAPSARSSVQRPQATTGDSSRRRLPISSFWSQRAVEETVGCSRSSTSARQTRFSRVTRVKTSSVTTTPPDLRVSQIPSKLTAPCKCVRLRYERW